MSLDKTQVNHIANLARLHLQEEEIEQATTKLNQVLNLLDNLQQINTQNIKPLNNPLEATQRLRSDVAIFDNQRDYYQSIAPSTADGLYLVPKVIE